MTYQEWLGFMQQYLQSVEKYSSIYSGQQIDTAVGKALNPDTTPTASSSALITSSAVKSAIDNVACRPNLLDNWYFVGGGSQQGGGQFPINQRGATSYTVDGYCIDRWSFDNDTSNSGSITFDSDGIKIAQGSAAWAPTSMHQVIDNPSRLAGKTVTLSVLVKTNVGYAQVLFYGNDSVLGSGAALADGSFTLITKTITLPNPLSMLWCVVYGSVESGNGNYGIVKAIKLELGDKQTLAHQENGVWVLNEIPNFQQELAKCQRYQLMIKGNETASFGTAISAGNYLYAGFIPTPVPLRAKPNATITGTVTSYSPANGFVALSLVEVSGVSETGVAVTVTLSSSVSNNNIPTTMMIFNGAGSLLLDANL